MMHVVLLLTIAYQLLDSPALLDLGHGTIRYRHSDIRDKDDSTQDKKTGYFYHPKIELSSAGKTQ